MRFGLAFLLISTLLAACGNPATTPDALDSGGFTDVQTVEDLSVDVALDATPQVDVEPDIPTDVMVSAVCPKALIAVAEGTDVVPGTVLHLSCAPLAGQPATSCFWTVAQPVGSVAKFQPSDTGVAVQFVPQLTGLYTIQVEAKYAGIQQPCQAQAAVAVMNDTAITAELTWHTPADKDETDKGVCAGADLDLHFAHPWADMADLDGDGLPDPWFDPKFDCFWGNPAPDWGSADPNIDDDPHFSGDDADGAGPEDVALTLPEDGKTYTIGVHVWNSCGFGNSLATLRVYAYGQLLFEDTVELKSGDLWRVATLDWPSADVLGCLKGKQKCITPCYAPPAALALSKPGTPTACP